MSYEPTKWQTGDIITLNKLNKLEQGVAAMMEEYEPTVWQIGDTVTSTKLNKLEQAVATLSENCGGGFEPKGVATITISGGLTVPGQEYFLFNVDSRGPLQSMSDVPDYGNVYRGVATLSGTTNSSVGTVGGGLYVAVNVVGSNGAIDADKVAVEFNDAEITGVTKLTFGDNVILTFQVPEDTQSGVSRISIFYDGGED